MRISIYDMDGTIVCSLHRYRTMPCGTRIDINHWRENEFRAYDDSLLPLAEQYKNDLADPNCYVIIATARVIREPDLRFIRDKLGMPNQIISRRDNEDSRSGKELKIKGLQKFFNLKQFRPENATFFEDNVAYLKGVCDHFNIRGVYVPSKQGH